MTLGAKLAGPSRRHPAGAMYPEKPHRRRKTPSVSRSFPTRRLIEDALLLGAAHFPRTLLVIGAMLLPAAALYFLPGLIVCVLFVWVPAGFSLTALLIERILEPVFAPYRDAP